MNQRPALRTLDEFSKNIDDDGLLFNVHDIVYLLDRIFA